MSKKGFELGHGKIASAHSFQLFGKTVNSATSLSYGNTLPLLPVLDDSPNGDVKKQDVFHVTVYENPSNSTVENLEDAVTDEKTKNKIDELEPPGKVKRQVIKLYQEEEKKENESFLKEHNRQVKEFNESILRRTNSKY